jgi:hypothetical protein
MKFGEPDSISPESVLNYAGIVAANCPGESIRTPDGIIAVTSSFKYSSDVWDYFKYIRLRVLFGIDFNVTRALLEEARMPIFPSNEQREPNQEDFRAMIVAGGRSTPQSRTKAFVELARLRLDLSASA